MPSDAASASHLADAVAVGFTTPSGPTPAYPNTDARPTGTEHPQAALIQDTPAILAGAG